VPVTLDRRDRVAILTLERPEALNVLSSQMLADLEARLDELEGDAGTGAIVLTGAGERAFSAGADVTGMRDAGPLDAAALSARGHRLADRLEASPVPVIAAINGFCLGGGCELALACDVRVASSAARIGLPEVTLGIIPGWGGTQRLTRLVGPGLASEMILSGRPVPADVALRHGLVTRVLEPAELLDDALALAAEIAARPPLAVAAAKRLIARAAGDLGPGLAHERDAFALTFATADKAEGVAAFLDKREPRFTGT
jgi:enoyl-CoA hydratase